MPFLVLLIIMYCQNLGVPVGKGVIAPLLPVPPALHLQHACPLTAEMAISHACMALLHIICIIYRTGKRSKTIFSVGGGQ